jgi:hypothetical protein
LTLYFDRLTVLCRGLEFQNVPGCVEDRGIVEPWLTACFSQLRLINAAIRPQVNVQ